MKLDLKNVILVTLIVYLIYQMKCETFNLFNFDLTGSRRREREKQKKLAEDKRNFQTISNTSATLELDNIRRRALPKAGKIADFKSRSNQSALGMSPIVQDPEQVRANQFKAAVSQAQMIADLTSAAVEASKIKLQDAKMNQLNYYRRGSVQGGIEANKRIKEEQEQQRKEDAAAKEKMEKESAERAWVNQFGPGSQFSGATVEYQYGEPVKVNDPETGGLTFVDPVTGATIVDTENPEYRNWMNMTPEERREARDLGTWGDLEAREAARTLRRDGPPKTAKQLCEEREGVKVLGFGPFPYEYTKSGNCRNTVWYWL